jgi:hypothetical protein
VNTETVYSGRREADVVMASTGKVFSAQLETLKRGFASESSHETSQPIEQGFVGTSDHASTPFAFATPDTHDTP